MTSTTEQDNDTPKKQTMTVHYNSSNGRSALLSSSSSSSRSLSAAAESPGQPAVAKKKAESPSPSTRNRRRQVSLEKGRRRDVANMDETTKKKEEDGEASDSRSSDGSGTNENLARADKAVASNSSDDDDDDDNNDDDVCGKSMSKSTAEGDNADIDDTMNAADNESDEDNDDNHDGPYIKATERDCICLKAATAEQRLHPGNFLFRKVVIEHSEPYRRAKNADDVDERARIVDLVLEEYQKLNGRLLQPPGGSNRGHGGRSLSVAESTWEELDEETARKKTRTALNKCLEGKGINAMRADERIDANGKLVQVSNGQNPSDGGAKHAGNDNDDNHDDSNEESEEDDNEETRNGDKTSTSSSPVTSPSLLSRRKVKVKPTEKDYLCVRHGTAAEWGNPGTIEYRRIFSEHVRDWNKAVPDTDEETRMNLVRSVYDSFRSTGGRFLSRIGNSKDSWYVLTEEDAIDRIRKNSFGKNWKRALAPKMNGGGSSKNKRNNIASIEKTPTSSTQKPHESKSMDQAHRARAGVISKPSEKDYLCIKSGSRNETNNPGNIEYRRLISEHAYDYQHASKGEEKVSIMKSVLLEFRRYGGRVLLPANDGNAWKEVKEEGALVKIRKALAGCTTNNKPQPRLAKITKTRNEDPRDVRHALDFDMRDDVVKIYKPAKEDYLCVPNGTKEQRSNPGNLEYRRIIKERSQAYCNAATSDRKLSIRSSVLKQFYATGGRFLAPGKGSTWYEMDEDTALKTVSKALLAWSNDNYRSSTPEKEKEKTPETKRKKVVKEEVEDTTGTDVADDVKTVKLSTKDCLCIISTRKEQINHPGTVRFNEIIEKYSPEYWSSETTTEGKRLLRENVIASFYKYGGRFVAPLGGKNEPGCSWVQIDDEVALRKVGNAFRRTQESTKARLKELFRKEKASKQRKEKTEVVETLEDDMDIDDGSRGTSIIKDRDVRPADYLCSQYNGGQTRFHKGNVSFRKMIDENAQLYYECGNNPECKKGIRRAILTAIRAYGGRILVSKNGVGAPWGEVDDRTALQKINRALRKSQVVDRSSPLSKISQTVASDDSDESESVSSARQLDLAFADSAPPTKRRKTDETTLPGAKEVRKPIKPILAYGDFQGSLRGATTGYDEYGPEIHEEYSDVEDLVF